MLVSYRWLETFFEKPLPGVEQVCEALTFGVFEIEGTEPHGDDTIINLKVLPDRACYALSHRGVAKEIATLLDVPMKDDPLRHEVPPLMPAAEGVVLEVENEKTNPVHVLALVKGVTVAPSPPWLKDALESVGQRSINNIVDATNYVMLHLGQPTHAFDWNKLHEEAGTRGITVRASKEGESITLLGGTSLVLPEGVAMLCDAHGKEPLDIAGIKGGVRAELDEQTTDVLITAASFNPVQIRKTATTIGIKTDASKRFENGVPHELPLYGAQMVVAMIVELAHGIAAGYVAVRPPTPLPFRVGISSREVARVLGSEVTDEMLEDTCRKLGFSYEKIEQPRDKIVTAARSYIGTPYKRMARIRYDTPEAFNCATLTAWCAIEAGYSFGTARITIDQFAYLQEITEAELEPGDFVFTNTGEIRTTDGENFSTTLGIMVKDKAIRDTTLEFMPGTAIGHGVDHVGVYVGDGKIVHAGSGVGGVVEESLKTSETFSREKWYRRVVTHDEARFAVTAPSERLDLRLREDLIEEVGRVLGYDTIPDGVLPKATTEPVVLAGHAWNEKIRQVLDDVHGREIYTYSLREKGAVPLTNPLSSDKGWLRDSLAPGMTEAIKKAEYNLPLLGGDDVVMYEIGTVFYADREATHLSVGVIAKPGKGREVRTDELLASIQVAIKSALPDVKVIRAEHGILEINLSESVGDTVPKQYPSCHHIAPSATYTPLSTYPFVLRDIALWVPDGITAEVAREEIHTHAGGSLVRTDLFDEFRKDGKVSYAFHLVFQSGEKTLSDDEVNEWMGAVVTAVTEKGWQVR